ncbi:MAG: serine/threonine protein kinase [Myxococcales bacterium]|nr:serine/threonine protein kinase [Myxococcales bacterium]MCB9583381.1 serine/threonine protein kinase [Polyangiaceae bacterium]
MLVEPATGLLIAGKYKLLERIGVGGMSEVYQAENVLIGRVVALKLLNPAQAGDRNQSARFFQEAQSVSRIRHPGLVDILDAGQGETGPYIVMEYLRGESVARVLARLGKLTVAAAVGTMLPVLDALSAAHEAGIIHRDLKPENIFYSIDERGELVVKLLDFGIAKMLWPAAPTPRTSTGVVFGTPDYLSPEQANGEVVLNGRSDLFAVGVVLYELLTGTRPFHAPTTVATAYKIAHARTPLLRDNGGPNEPTIDAILQRALAKRPDERYPSAAEMAREIATLCTPQEMERALLSVVEPAAANSVSGVRSRNDFQVVPSRTNKGIGESWSEPPPAENPRIGDTRPSLDFVPRRPTPPRLSRPPAEVPTRESALHTPTPTPASLGRSLPARFVGQCHARGIVLRAFDQYLLKSFGPVSRNGIIESLGPAAVDDLVQGTVQAIVYYDLDLVTRYIERATTNLCRGNPAWCRMAGEASVTGELAQVLKMALRPDHFSTILRRLVPVLSRLFDFGIWEVEGGEKLSTVRVADFEPASLGLRMWLVGVIEGSLAACDANTLVTISRGEAAFAPQLVLDVSPRY